jgi:hypothetical protein
MKKNEGEEKMTEWRSCYCCCDSEFKNGEMERKDKGSRSIALMACVCNARTRTMIMIMIVTVVSIHIFHAIKPSLVCALNMIVRAVAASPPVQVAVILS